MSEQSTANVGSTTGVSRAQPATASLPAAAEDGKRESSGGKTLPADQPNEDLAAVVERLNRASRTIGRQLRFEVDLANGSSVIQVLDRETGEIIRQIPPEDVRTYVQGNGSLAIRLFEMQA